MARNNPYIAELQDFPDYILSHPEQTDIEQLWQEQLLSEKNLHVDLGCGSGKFLLQLCTHNPSIFGIGIELRYKRLVLGARKYKKLQMDNVFLMQLRAERLPELFPENSIQSASINFPDPWPKARHQKHRLFQPKFLKGLKRLLKPGGTLTLKTDHADYFQFALESMKDVLEDYDVLEQTADLYQSDYQEHNLFTEFELLFKHKHQPPIGYLKALVKKP